MAEDNKKDLTFAEIIDKINEQLQISDDSISKPTIDELNQFQKTWFYHNWDVRFRKLASFSALGTRGAIAIPNTTFEEWLYWFHEWAIHFADDYNDFKKLVYQAIKLLEKHMEVIDKRLTEIENRLTEIEGQLRDIYNKLEQINSEIVKLKERVTRLENDLQNKYNANIILLDVINLDISSSMIRQRILEEKRIDFFTSKEVVRYIKDNNLYKGD